MIKYFISYKLVDENKNINNSKLKIFKKNKNGSYRVESIGLFDVCIDNIKIYAKLFENNKKGITLMYELTEDELKNYKPLYIKKLKSEDNKNFNIIKEENILKLINYNTFINMSYKELNSGFIVSLNSNFNGLILDIEENDLFKREKLLNNFIGSDMYFYTDDKKLLEKYSSDLTILEEIDLDIYQFIYHKVIAIDSISQDRVYDFNNSSIAFLYNVCDKSISVNAYELDNGRYELSLKKSMKNSKKIYMITDYDLRNLVFNAPIEPLLKYINIYELDKNGYKKINLEDYLTRENILKYIKKPNIN